LRLEAKYGPHILMYKSLEKLCKNPLWLWNCACGAKTRWDRLIAPAVQYSKYTLLEVFKNSRQIFVWISQFQPKFDWNLIFWLDFSSLAGKFLKSSWIVKFIGWDENLLVGFNIHSTWIEKVRLDCWKLTGYLYKSSWI